MGLKAYSAAIPQFTTVLVTVNVYCPGHGGGGCISSGTPIYTPGGVSRIQDLTLGQTVYGYNVSTHSLVSEHVSGLNSTSATALLGINWGQLNLTFTDQPIWIANSTGTHWLTDPENLSVGDLLYDPQSGTWIPVVNLTGVSGTATVYDLSVTGPTKDFVAGLVVVGIKPHEGSV